MSTDLTTEARLLEEHLQKWISRGQVRNVRLRPAYAHPAIPLGQVAVAEVVNRNGESTFFAETGFVLPGRGFIPYSDIRLAAMYPQGVSRSSLKGDGYDHLQLVLNDGSSTVLTSLEQAVFPVLTFFEGLVRGRGESEGEPSGSGSPAPA